jgi:uncharacterized membrane protein YphA (DoxX/SURF4 family)
MVQQPDSWQKDVSRAYALLRLTLGLNIFLHGVVRCVAGLGSFAQSLVPMFQKTPLPSWSVYGFGLVLPILEAVVGAAVAAGYRTRTALVAGAALMLVLVFGTASGLANRRDSAHILLHLLCLARRSPGRPILLRLLIGCQTRCCSHLHTLLKRLSSAVRTAL